MRGKDARERGFQACAKAQRHDVSVWVEGEYKADVKDSWRGLCVQEREAGCTGLESRAEEGGLHYERQRQTRMG